MNEVYPTTTRRWCLLVVLLLFFCSLRAQDIHFSQYYTAPFSVNPGLVGMFEGDQRFGLTYRSQWQSALVPYTTLLGSYDQKLQFRATERGFFSGGFQFYYDAAGVAKFSTTNLSAVGSYSFVLNEESYLSIGLQAGLAQRAFQLSKLTFDNQWNGEKFEETRAIQENFDRTSLWFPDFGGGINFHGRQRDSRSSLDVGIALFHPFRPNQSFSSSDVSRLPIRYSAYLLPTLQVTDRLDLVLHGMAQLQNVSVEALGGGGLRFHLNTQPGKRVAVQAGGAYRFNSIGDAFIPSVELHYRGWRAAFSYDINVSGFSVATNRNGGPEFSIRHIITHVKPLREFKLCPLI